jgi:hypothetical protein
LHEIEEKRKILFYKIVGMSRLFMDKAKFSGVKEKLPSYLNEKQQFGYKMSNKMCP